MCPEGGSHPLPTDCAASEVRKSRRVSREHATRPQESRNAARPPVLCRGRSVCLHKMCRREVWRAQKRLMTVVSVRKPLHDRQFRAAAVPCLHRMHGREAKRPVNSSGYRARADRATCGSACYPQTVPPATRLQVRRLAGPGTTRKRFRLPYTCRPSDLRVRLLPANGSTCNAATGPATCGSRDDP